MRFIGVAVAALVAACSQGCSDTSARGQVVSALRAAGQNTADVNAFNAGVDEAIVDIHARENYGALKAAARRGQKGAKTADIDFGLAILLDERVGDGLVRIALAEARAALVKARVPAGEIEARLAEVQALARAAQRMMRERLEAI